MATMKLPYTVYAVAGSFWGDLGGIQTIVHMLYVSGEHPLTDSEIKARGLEALKMVWQELNGSSLLDRYPHFTLVHSYAVISHNS